MNANEYYGVLPDEKPLDRIVSDGGFCSIFRTIACIGDSLASGEFESTDEEGNRRYHDMFEYSWGQYIGRSCGSKVYNFSRGGMTAKEYVESFADASGFWDKDKLAQAYIIALGTNDIFTQKIKIGDTGDINEDDPEKNAETFTGYYARIIQRLKVLQPRAKFFLVTMPRHGDEQDKERLVHRNILEEMTRIFDRTYIIDLYSYAPANDAEYSKIFWNGHLTPAGYVLTARMIESYIDFLVRKYPEQFKQVGLIGTDLYYGGSDSF